jgi:hypothetical protein
MATMPKKTRKEMLDEAEDKALKSLMPEEPEEVAAPPMNGNGNGMRRKKVDNYPWD